MRNHDDSTSPSPGRGAIDGRGVRGLLARSRWSAEDRATYDNWAWGVVVLYALMGACLIGGALVSAPSTEQRAATDFTVTPPYP